LLNPIVSNRKCVFLAYDPGLYIDPYFHDLAAKNIIKITGLDKVKTPFTVGNRLIRK